jgi:tetratricopeptide (TPR) repeat protein
MRRYLCALLLLVGAPVFADCKLSKIADLPVTMHGSQPLVNAKINGQDAAFVADSGAFYSTISAASAAQYKLRLEPAPAGIRLTGVGGSVETFLTRVKEFTFVGVPIHDVEFLVAGSDVSAGDSVGLLGQNLFRLGDVEYDLGKGAIRLMQAKDCSHTRLAYWITPDQAYSVIAISPASRFEPHTTGVAYLNGTKIRVMFDTGAGSSVLATGAAERAGVRVDSPGVTDAGLTGGIGRALRKTYVGNFQSFKIGDEEIRNARLRFGDIGMNIDMLLGADFFLSHRVYVARGQNLLYFTYNGGPIFNLASASKPQEVSDEQLPDAAAYSRRGTARAARHEYDQALADLTRACELAPDNADFFYQRGIIYRDSKHPAEALGDFDKALSLKGDDVDALIGRGELHIEQHEFPAAKSDLGLASQTVAKESDMRMTIARGYMRMDDREAALAQLDIWIGVHSADSKLPEALNERCQTKALLATDLPKALSDCNTALNRSVDERFKAEVYRNRALVRLRLGDFAKALLDYDAAVKIDPQNPWGLYGRGLAKIRLKKQADGESDLAAAAKLNDKVADYYQRHGITP